MQLLVHGRPSLCDGNDYLDLAEGEVLINEGDAGDAYCVVAGEVLVWKVGEFGPIEPRGLVGRDLWRDEHGG